MKLHPSGPIKCRNIDGDECAFLVPLEKGELILLSPRFKNDKLEIAHNCRRLYQYLPNERALIQDREGNIGLLDFTDPTSPKWKVLIHCNQRPPSLMMPPALMASIRPFVQMQPDGKIFIGTDTRDGEVLIFDGEPVKK
ncbi:hypothetical protein EXS71_01765 [Candidatus Uhrbacteria bacterium]|nr:hypothetical protein [Candidatus Uhrbacteria bacterium]